MGDTRISQVYIENLGFMNIHVKGGYIEHLRVQVETFSPEVSLLLKEMTDSKNQLGNISF